MRKDIDKFQYFFLGNIVGLIVLIVGVALNPLKKEQPAVKTDKQAVISQPTSVNLDDEGLSGAHAGAAAKPHERDQTKKAGTTLATDKSATPEAGSHLRADAAEKRLPGAKVAPPSSAGGKIESGKVGSPASQRTEK